jgi:glycosyltransferase involved in cell wall biosynthesis
MTLPLISIVTPSFNQAAYLAETLQSVRNQQYPAQEHIVIDGASTDGSPALLQAIGDSASGSHLRWSSKPDQGQSSALNEGFLQARGDIIGWLNADDRYRSGCFHHVAAAFAENPEVDILYGDYTFIDPDGVHLALRREIDFSQFILNYHRVLYIPTTATFFRHRILEEGHLLNTNLHLAMDVEFFIRLSAAGYRFHHLPRVLADFRIHPASKSIRFLKQQRKEHRRVILSSTPIASLIHPPFFRNLAASALQIPAALLRYSEKFIRGYYFRERSESLFLQEQIRGWERP